jgi:hypothetical protein
MSFLEGFWKIGWILILTVAIFAKNYEVDFTNDNPLAVNLWKKHIFSGYNPFSILEYLFENCIFLKLTFFSEKLHFYGEVPL